MDDKARATVAAKLSTYKRGDNQHTAIAGTSQAKAAKLLNVSPAKVERVAKILKTGAPELVAAFEQGEVSISAGAAVASLPVEEQREIVAAGPEAVVEAAKEIRETPKEIVAEIVSLFDESKVVAPKAEVDATAVEPETEVEDEGADGEEIVPDNWYFAGNTFDDVVSRISLSRMPRHLVIELSNRIHRHGLMDREREAARWVWQYRQGAELSYPAKNSEGELIKKPKDDSVIRKVAREVNADGRSALHRGEEYGHMSKALAATDGMGDYGPLSVLAFSYWALTQAAPQSEVSKFFEVFEAGLGRTIATPGAREVVRNALIDNRQARNPFGPNDIAEIILRGWIDYRLGIAKKRKPIGKVPTLEELSPAPLKVAA
jgi:DNA-binding transcriptional regulator YdaS (Cro superfamily)